MILEYLFVGMLGKLLMYFLRLFPPAVKVAEYIHFKLDCDLCLGFWVYLFLMIVFQINLLDGYTNLVVFDQIVTAAITSFLVHLVAVGWAVLFGGV